mgnify:CR=1 FL=1
MLIYFIYKWKSTVRLINNKKKRKETNFRLYQIAKYLSTIEQEFQNREHILKKYKRGNSILIKCSAIGGTLSVVLSVSAIGTSLTGTGLPVGASLAAVDEIFGITSVVTEVFVKSMFQKLEMHQKTVSVCFSKINTIKDIVSKALDDNRIYQMRNSNQLEEIRKYSDMKKSIR